MKRVLAHDDEQESCQLPVAEKADPAGGPGKAQSDFGAPFYRRSGGRRAATPASGPPGGGSAAS